MRSELSVVFESALFFRMSHDACLRCRKSCDDDHVMHEATSRRLFTDFGLFCLVFSSCAFLPLEQMVSLHKHSLCCTATGVDDRQSQKVIARIFHLTCRGRYFSISSIVL
jgi:hypothetical protein